MTTMHCGIIIMIILTLDLSPSSCCRSTSSDPSLDPELHPMSDPTNPDLFSLLKSMTLLGDNDNYKFV